MKTALILLQERKIMKKFTFLGGTHVREHKETASTPATRLPEPAFVSIPLSQHIGVPAKPVVAPGDHVDIGTVIGAALNEDLA